jgi:hypothetical protein
MKTGWILLFSNTDGVGKKKRMRRELGEEDGIAVAGAAQDRGPEVREAELGAGDLDRFRCFSLCVLEAAEKAEEWSVWMTKGNFGLCTLRLRRWTGGIHMIYFQK